MGHTGFTEAKGDSCSQVSNLQLPLAGQELKRCHYIYQPFLPWLDSSTIPVRTELKSSGMSDVKQILKCNI